MNILIEKQFEFNLWANIEMITICTSLDKTQLTVEVLGVYGQIKPTIIHIVRSEGNYLCDLGGNPPWAEDIAWDALSLEDLLTMAKQSGRALSALAKSISPEKQCEFSEEGERYVFPAWLVINQAINHGIEHRTQLRLLLTKLGVPHPGQSVWGYAESIGALQIHKIAKE